MTSPLSSPSTARRRLTLCEAIVGRIREAVLLDANVLIETFRLSAWRALSGGYDCETVEECVVETQTGFQNRRPEQQIDLAMLRTGLKAVNDAGFRPKVPFRTAYRRDWCERALIEIAQREGKSA